MKRPCPVPAPLPEPGYPAAIHPAPSRRAFLAAVLGGATTAVAGGRGASGQAGGLTRVDLVLRTRHVFAGCELAAERLIVQTRDRRLAEWLRVSAEQPALEAAVLAVLRPATCADVTDRKKLGALEARLARTVQAHYRARTRRATAVPIVTLVLGRRHVQIDGFLSAPAAPVPRP